MWKGFIWPRRGQTFGYCEHNNNDNNYYYYYLLQLGFYPMAVVILHVYKI